MFTLAVGLVLATVFVRLRDVGQVWELVVQLLFFASPIIYPVGFLPPWAKPIAFVNPFVQVMQDVRAVDHRRPAGRSPSPTSTGPAGPTSCRSGSACSRSSSRSWLFRRESPWFAERV